MWRHSAATVKFSGATGRAVRYGHFFTSPSILSEQRLFESYAVSSGVSCDLCPVSFQVYGQVAKSLVWLEGHVKKHLGPQPYFCIFEGCSRRFSNQELLQRHVDSHFNQTEQSKVVKKVDVPVKKEKKNVKRLRGREKCIRECLIRPLVMMSSIYVLF